MVAVLAPPRRVDVTPLFQVVLDLAIVPSTSHELPGLEVLAVPAPASHVRFDLEVHATRRGGAMQLRWLYNRQLFDEWRIARWAVTIFGF